jgi:hypothetical protein
LSLENKLNINKSFQEIISQTSSPHLLHLLSSILSTGHKQLCDKNFHIKKQKHQLSLSNLSQLEYSKKQAEIEYQETSEIRHIKEDILSKLQASRVKGSIKL